MRLSRFFITRPIFAVVLSLGIVVAGALALLKLPISEEGKRRILWDNSAKLYGLT